MVRTRRYSSVLVSVALALGLFLAAAHQAAAQPPAPPFAVQPPGAVPVIIVQPRPRMHRWGIGVHLGGMGVRKHEDDGNDDGPKTDLGLVGLQLRYRLHRRWELELAFSYMEGQLPDLGDTRRSTASLILGGMFHINPDSRWLWSVLFGIGGARDAIWYEKQGDRIVQSEFAEGLVRLGVGLERRFESWGLAAQLYGVGLERDDDKLDGPAYVDRDGPVPQHSSACLFQLVASYYF